MKRMKLFLILSMFSACLTAPPAQSIAILQTEAVNPYMVTVHAIATIESANGKHMLNEKEMAVGYFGIRPIRLNAYNEETGNCITLDQCYNYETGKKILLYYISQIDYRDIKAMAISWNGISKKNLYYAKLQKQLLSL